MRRPVSGSGYGSGRVGAPVEVGRYAVGGAPDCPSRVSFPDSEVIALARDRGTRMYQAEERAASGPMCGSPCLQCRLAFVPATHHRAGLVPEELDELERLGQSVSRR